jgi:hypothetical protein
MATLHVSVIYGLQFTVYGLYHTHTTHTPDWLAMGWMAEVQFQGGAGLLSSQIRPDGLWILPTLRFNACLGLFPRNLMIITHWKFISTPHVSFHMLGALYIYKCIYIGTTLQGGRSRV